MTRESRHLISFPFSLRTRLTDYRKIVLAGKHEKQHEQEDEFSNNFLGKKKFLKIADIIRQNILLLRDRYIPLIVLTSQMTNKLLRLRQLSSSGNLVCLKMSWLKKKPRFSFPHGSLILQIHSGSQHILSIAKYRFAMHILLGALKVPWMQFRILKSI